MFNIEGTPHEKALLVISSYIIGFVSAYIAFVYAFPGHDNMSTITYIPTPPTQTAAITDSQALPNQETSTTTSPAIEVVYENQGLYVYGVTEAPLLLSKLAEAVDFTYTDDMALQEKQGLHSKIAAFEYWAPNNMVYFCENYQTADACVPYLYDIDSARLYVVQTGTSPITVANQDAKDAVLTTSGELQIGEYTSVAGKKLWMVEAR